MPIDPDVNYIGEYLDLQTLEYANELMPENYMWAIGTQVASSAKMMVKAAEIVRLMPIMGTAMGKRRLRLFQWRTQIILIIFMYMVLPIIRFSTNMSTLRLVK